MGSLATSQAKLAHANDLFEQRATILSVQVEKRAEEDQKVNAIHVLNSVALSWRGCKNELLQRNRTWRLNCMLKAMTMTMVPSLSFRIRLCS